MQRSQSKSKGSRSNFIRKSHRYKRKFSGNQFTAESCKKATSASAKKIRGSEEFDVQCNGAVEYVILSFSCVFLALSKFVKCKECNGEITFTKEPISGLAFKLVLTCPCRAEKINSCKQIDKSYEINRKITFVMRLLGVGQAGLNLFCSLMDLSSAFSTRIYYGALDNIHIATKAVFDCVIQKAGKEEKALNKSKDLPEDELAVSGDGTWAKRGFSSLVGVTSLIGKFSGKVLDIFISSKRCQACETAKKKMNPTDFLIWSETEHAGECEANYEGSSGGMEVQGVLEMFKRSISIHKAKYAYYIGDGDSKTFTNLLECNPYGNFVVKKLECVLHVGKRMFRRLKEAKKHLTEKKKIIKQQEEKKKKEEEELKKKEIAATSSRKRGANKKIEEELVPKKKRSSKKDGPQEKVVKTQDLTGKIMKEMSLFFGTSIQNNPDSIENMRKSIWAYYYHRCSTDEKPQHQNCDISWCKYLQSKDKNLQYVHKPALSEEVQEVVRPIYESLTDDALLKRCLGRNTQNNNESLNSTIWNIVPKQFYHGKKTVEIASWLSVCTFNEGSQTLLKIMDVMNIDIGPHAAKFVENKDDKRIREGEKRSSNQSKEARIARKKERQEQEEAFEKAYGLLYGPGMAN